MLVSVSRRVLSSFIVPCRFIFFNYYLIFCAHLHFLSLAPKSCLLCFLPHRGRESHLASRFVKLLSKCRFFPIPPYFSQSASLQGFVNLLNVGKLVYEICFFLQTEPSIYCFWKAFVYNDRQENLHCIVLCCLPLMRCPYHKWRCISYTELCKDQTKVEVRKYGKVGSYQVWHHRHD